MGSVTYDLDSRRHRYYYSRHQDEQRYMAGGVRLSPDATENVVLSMSKDELSQTVELAVQRGLADAIGLYLDTRDDREEVKADFRFARQARKAFNSLSLLIGKTLLTGIIGLFLAGMAAIMWVGFKFYVK